ncbi:hypothetical protein BZA05DRAFT_411408 [Tricharina praecox]|uniref:uncharacterized protein n=1 Tax=Tricharina praecox TaxID=43433 RepID=UPI00221F3ECE|nr:uncharacterized protein BZA05DRAFT_411408 [Tricharina praecox]KAI5843198.1 hypothetical protein BZA05DRAFT_411408 [Tricharina praecox]
MNAILTILLLRLSLFPLLPFLPFFVIIIPFSAPCRLVCHHLLIFSSRASPYQPVLVRTVDTAGSLCAVVQPASETSVLSLP